MAQPKKYRLASLRHWVFWPPFILLLVAAALSLWDEDWFLTQVKGANNWILDHFDWLFSGTGFVLVILCLVVLFSPLGKVKIGGKEAKPFLTRWKWFSIILCTTIAVGILFWGTAEPLSHLTGPPDSLGIEPNSPAAARFSMSSMFMHWSFTPYAIYAVPALLFALAYYNRKRSFSLGSMLFPFFKRKPNLENGIQSDRAPWQVVLNALCLFALVAGMAGSLGAGILSLSGGISSFGPDASNRWWLGGIALLIVISFTVSSASGLLKGIRILSDINVRIFVAITLFVFIAGPTSAILTYLWEGLQEYAVNFVPHSLAVGDFADESWNHSWTTFYWANWMAWAPVTALFLGRLAYGRTVREFLVFNWILPAFFSILWMAVFSGATLHFEMEGGAELALTMQENGSESVAYALLEKLPWAKPMIIIFLITIFLSYVTAADSTTDAMSGLSSSGLSPESPNPPVYLKFVWGTLVGLVAWIMISFAGVDGVKMLSNLGGLPALFLLVAAGLALTYLLIRSWKKGF